MQKQLDRSISPGNAMNHEIVIDNVKPGETIHYPVLILKGGVLTKPNSPCQVKPEIALNGTTFKISEGKFKILTELKSGENLIRLTYCCQSSSIILNHQPRSGLFTVFPLYIICDGHDGKFQAPETENNDIMSACDRITTCTKLLQSVFGEKLYEENLGRKSFNLESECKVFRSKLGYLEAKQMDQRDLWESLGREILNSELGKIGNRKFLGFLSCTKYHGEHFEEANIKTYEDILKLTEGYVALGGGGLALFGTACLFTWPETFSHVIPRFEDSTPIDRKRFMDDSNYRGTLGSCFSTTLGSVLHELCHTFDLGHTEVGIMGRGFDDISKVFLVGADMKPQLHRSNIEFKEKFSERLSERLQDEKKEFCVKNARTKDEIFWTRSCLMIIAYHKWFNDYKSNSTTKFDSATRILTSTIGLRVVELRREDDGMVVKHWVFDGKVLKYSFQIPADCCSSPTRLEIVVVDNLGNVLKDILT